ncbi:hypothetical protein AMECASPLE_010038 [Ameca splendens]|uniref:Uncharacterized protein n=1 Tax=Ameca splendens TaxID=208324 RepID=A0ABV0Y0B0_9TELE
MMEDFRRSGMEHWVRDWLKMLVKTPASWSPQSLSTLPVTQSGPAAFWGFTALRTGGILLSPSLISCACTVKVWLRRDDRRQPRKGQRSGLPVRHPGDYSGVAGSEVGDVLDSLPHMLTVVAVEILLNPLLVVCLSLSDSPLQSSSSTAVQVPVPGPESAVSLPQHFLDLLVHPGLLVGKHPNVPVHCDGVNTVLDVAEHC